MARLYNGGIYIYIIREKALSLFNEAIISLSLFGRGALRSGASSISCLYALVAILADYRLITLHAVAGLLSRGFFVILDNLVPYELIPTSAPAAPRRYASSFRQKMADVGSLMNTYNRRGNPFLSSETIRSPSSSIASINATN